MDKKYEGAMARTLRAEQHQNTQDHHDTCDDTNERVRHSLTFKQFVVGLLLMWVTCTFIGKATSGRYWFEAGNEEWLWSSHNMLVAIVEDDPKFLTKDDGWAWKRFQETASTTRLNGFIRVVHDGEHPNLQKWYDRDHDQIAGH